MTKCSRFSRSAIAVALLSFAVSQSSYGDLVFSSNDYILQNSPQVGDDLQTDAVFGFSLAALDNLLVIGAPREASNGQKGGAIYKLVGTPFVGLVPNEQNARFSQQDEVMAGAPEDGDLLGFSVAAGYFAGPPLPTCEEYQSDDPDYPDCDSIRTIVAGVPTEDLSGDVDAGMATLSLVFDPRALQSLSQADLFGTVQEGDRFGYSMVVGDFNSDGYDDIAIGAPGESQNAGLATNAGGVNVVMGRRSRGGLHEFNNEIFSQSNLSGGARDDENFGYALAAGDFNGDFVDDLAVGVPRDVQTDGPNRAGGAVNVLYGEDFNLEFVDEGGLRISGNQLFHQDTGGIVGASEEGDRFGDALASGDFNNDGYDDLAVGVAYEHIGSIADAGAVVIIYGSSNGLTSANNHSIHQNTAGVDGACETGDYFGASLAVGDFNDDGVDDLAVGIPLEDIGSAEDDHGAVQIFFGVDGGRLNGINNDLFFTQASLGTPGFLTEGEQFGHSLTVGDFDVDGKDDLAIGTRGQYGSRYYDGSVSVVYQNARTPVIMLDGFEE